MVTAPLSFSANITCMLDFAIDSIKLVCCFEKSTLGYATHNNFDNSTCFNIVFFIKLSLPTISLKREKSNSMFSLIAFFFFLKKKLNLFRIS